MKSVTSYVFAGLLSLTVTQAIADDLAANASAEDIEKANVLLEQKYQKSLNRQSTLQDMDYEVELMKRRAELVQLMDDCQRTGSNCFPKTPLFDLNIDFLGTPTDQYRSTGSSVAPGGIQVPDMSGLGGNLAGKELRPGDAGYRPEFDPNNRQAPIEPQTQDLSESESDPQEAKKTRKDEVKFAPRLAGVENGKALFATLLNETATLAKVSPGEPIPGTKSTWKVVSVDFDVVVVDTPTEKNRKLFIEW